MLLLAPFSALFANDIEAVKEFMDSGNKTMVITREENIENIPDVCIIKCFNIGSHTIVISQLTNLQRIDDENRS